MTSDALYHRLFSHPVMVEQLIRDFIPDALAVGLDFARMERVTAKFHDQRFGLRREGDVIWRIATLDGSDIYLHLLLEFQSTIDPWMAVRTQIYQGLLWQGIIDEQGLRNGAKLPPVLSVVLYNGNPTWTAADRVANLIHLPVGSPLWPWQPQVRYHLLDMGRFPVDDLVQRRTLSALLFRLEQSQEPDDLVELIDEVIGWFRQHPAYDGLKYLFSTLVGQAMIGAGVEGPLPGDLQEMKTMLATLGAEWREKAHERGVSEGLARGLAQGKAEGKAEGEATGRIAILIRLIERRFGPLSASNRQQIEAASIAQLDLWGDRVLEAESLDAMLESAPH